MKLIFYSISLITKSHYSEKIKFKKNNNNFSVVEALFGMSGEGHCFYPLKKFKIKFNKLILN